MSAPTIHYGCHECLRGHDETTLDVAACPHCGGLTEPMPADEQPTIEARRAVAWALAGSRTEEGAG